MRNHFAFHLMNLSKRQAHYTPRTPLSEFWFNKVGLGRPLSVPFLLRNSGKGSHRRAGSSGLRKRTHFSTTINLCYKVSTLLLSSVAFSEIEPFLRGILCWNFWSQKHVQGVFFQMVPPRKVLSMELVPLNRIRWLSTLVPLKVHQMSGRSAKSQTTLCNCVIMLEYHCTASL